MPLEENHDYKVVQAGIRALRDLARQDKPWCLYVGTHGPHDPFIVPEQYACLYSADDVELPANYRDSLEDKPRVYQHFSNWLAIL